MKTKEKNIFTLILIVIISVFPFSEITAQHLNDSILPDRDKAIKYAYRNLNGIGVKLNYEKAYYIFKKLAENGDGEASNA